MRRYYIISGILLIPSIINFSVAAPALVQEKRQSGVNMVHLPEGTIAMLGKRGDELNDLWLKFFSNPESYLFGKPEESSVVHASSSFSPSGPADESMDVNQPLPYAPEEPLPMPIPDHTQSSLADEMDEQWLEFFSLPENSFFLKPEKWSAKRPPSTPAPADGWTDVGQPLPSIPEEPPSGPADDWMDAEEPLPSIAEGPLSLSTQGHAPPIPGSLTESGYELMN
jgi:hypothetical protein